MRWDSFQPNFFVVFSPGVLDEITGTLITSVHVETAQRPALVELVRRFPEVTIIDIDALLSQVREVMDKAALAVQYVFLFTLLAGLTVLVASVQATRDERRFESAMLRTLGASRRVVFQGIAAEFMALGALAGLLAAAGATVAGYFLAREVFDLKYTPGLLIWLVGFRRWCRARRRRGGTCRALGGHAPAGGDAAHLGRGCSPAPDRGGCPPPLGPVAARRRSARVSRGPVTTIEERCRAQEGAPHVLSEHAGSLAVSRNRRRVIT